MTNKMFVKILFTRSSARRRPQMNTAYQIDCFDQLLTKCSPSGYFLDVRLIGTKKREQRYPELN